MCTVICGIASAQISTRETPVRNPQTKVEESMPVNQTSTIAKDTLVGGEILTICAGYTTKWGGVRGLIRVRSEENDNIVYSILTPADKTHNYKAGQLGAIRVKPIPNEGKYFLPGQLCETIRKGDIIVEIDQ